MSYEKAKKFWNAEYKEATHLALSEDPADDLEKFLRWLDRRLEKPKFRQSALQLGPLSLTVDFGCGNGRNLIHVARETGCRGIGYDISEEAIRQARRAGEGLPLTFQARSITGTFPDLSDESVDLALDMMTSHVLREADREVYRAELLRILRPGGFLFLKTFLADEDLHAARLLAEHPGGEEDSYIHPEIHVYEHVWWEDKLKEFLEPDFIIHKVEKSHKHMIRGKAWKRRYVVVYCERGY